MAVSNKALISQATARENQRAKAPKKSGKPVFLFFKPGQKALVRPMFSIDDAITLNYHNKWSDNPDYKVQAVCATERGEPCQHCSDFKELGDKQLKASATIFLPVYVYSVIDVETGKKVTYTEKDEHDNKIEKPVSGFRVLELPLFGKPLMILQTFMAHERDEDLIVTCDFSIEQQGGGQGKNFITSPKVPKPVDERIAKACPGIDRFHQVILEARPPLVTSDNAVSLEGIEQSASDTIPVDEDEIAVF